MRNSGAALMVATLLLSGCAEFYRQPGAGEASAQLAIHMPADAGLLEGKPKFGVVEVSGFADAQCSPAAGNGRLVAFGSLRGGSERVRVAAGRRLYLQALSIDVANRTVITDEDVARKPSKEKSIARKQIVLEVTTSRCIRVASFVPEAGKSYSMLVEGAAADCVVSLKEAGTGQAPPDLQAHEVEGACIPNR